MALTFLNMQKEYFQLRGELQNDTITGVNNDEKTLCKKLLNREMRSLAELHPPFLQHQWHLRMMVSTTLLSSGAASVTGSKNRPWMVDSASNLKDSDIYNTVTDGTYRFTVTDVVGTTYYLDNSLIAEATTGGTWTAYKNHYPLPHNVGDIHTVFYEDGEREVPLLARAEFQELGKLGDSSSQPYNASVGIFSNEWGDYKKQETSVTVANASREITVADASFYQQGDVALFSGNHLHTIVGVSTTDNNMWLDRNYTGTTTNVTMTINPKEFTEYISFYRYPSSEEDIIINGYIKPQDMVANTDQSHFPDEIAPAIVIGALLRDKVGREALTDQWIQYYEKVRRELMSKKNARVYDNLRPPTRWGNRTDQYDFSLAGL